MSNADHEALLDAMYPPKPAPKPNPEAPPKPPRGMGLCILCSAWTNFRNYWVSDFGVPYQKHTFYLCSAHPKTLSTRISIANLLKVEVRKALLSLRA